MQPPVPARLTAAASCPAWKLSTATGLVNCAASGGVSGQPLTAS